MDFSVCDDTVREGLQTPGISFSIEEKIKIARIIGNSGVKRALVSYPSAHISEIETTKNILKNNIFRETFALGRAIKKDVDIIGETGANISLHLPFDLKNLQESYEAINYARKYGKLIEVAVVDVVNHTVEEIEKIVDNVVKSGADIVQLPDTTGSGTPDKIRNVFRRIRSNYDLKLETHCHNDHGMSIANTIAALEEGADFADCTVFGIGERNGIADLLSISRYAKSMGIKTGINEEKLLDAYENILNLILKKIGPDFFLKNFPNFGDNVKTNTAGTHVSYSDVFSGKEFSVNVYTGRSVISKILKMNGMELSEDSLKKLVDNIKDISSQTGKCLKTDEIVKLAGEFIENN
ncbi:hypothetical protein [Caldiplasma sukawensis]